MAAEQIFNAPIPGQSLTQDPNMRGPWEMPPKFSSANQAIDHLFSVVTSEKFITNYDKLMSEDKKFYVDRLATSMLEEGFINGLWSVDVMLMLVEPLIIQLVWAAAQLDRSPSFSNDTGYEDRTGFEDVTQMVLEGAEVPTAPQETPEEAQMEAPEQPEIPPQLAQVAQNKQSPLVGGM